MKHAFEIGAGLASGTDAGSLLTPHGSAGREVVAAGAVRAVAGGRRSWSRPSSTARLLKRRRRGWARSIQGKLADVIVVDGDVCAHVESLESRTGMRHVFVGGRQVAAAGRVLPA